MAMTVVQYALTKLSEELTEAAQECAKIAQFGFDSFNPTDVTCTSNLERLLNELHDVEGAKAFLQEVSYGKFEFVPNTLRALNKMDKIRRHLDISISMGHVESEDEISEDEEE